jgi:microcystin-dependent protein
VSSISSITHLFIKNTGRYRSAYRVEVMYKDTNTDRIVYHGGYRWMNTSSDVTSLQMYTDVVSTGTIRVYSQESLVVPMQYAPSGSVGIQSIKVTYKSDTELSVYPGTIHIEGSSFEGYYNLDSEITKTLNSLSANSWYYIYINPPSIGHTITSTSIVYSTDAPVLNVNKCGYYHTTNDGWRCIWVVRTDGSNNIRECVGDSNKIIYTGAYSVDVENVVQTTSPNTYTILVPSFCNVAYSMIRYHAASGGANLYWRSQMVGTANDSSDRTLNTLDLILDSNKQGTLWVNAGTGTARVETYGYYLPYEIYNSPANISGLSQSFIDLDDTPTTYSGSVGKYLRVTASGIEFAEVSSGGGSSDVQSFLDLDDTPTTYSGSVGKYLRTTASGVDLTDEIHGTYLYVDGNATITGTVYASAYDSLSPLVLKAGGKTVMEADDITGIPDFKHGISINGLTISGVNDGSSPVGSIIWHAAETAPDGYLVCDGSAISRSTYSALYSVIGTLYGVGDGSTTFNIPDLRSEFIRGAGLGRGLDGDHAVGTTQSGTEHLALSTNPTPTRVHIGYESYFDISTKGGEDVTTESLTGTIDFDYTSSTYLNKTYRSRPRNVALLPCIRYNPRFASDEVIKYISTGKQSIKVEYATTSGIYVNPGEIHLKTTYDISNVLETRTYVDAGLTTGDGPDTYYVYASVSGSILSFDVSSTEPTIDYTNMGWYNGNSRCIGSVYVESGGIIKRFKESRGNYTWLANLYILSSTNVTTTPTSISWVAPVYTNEIQATFYLDTYGANGGLYYADSDSTDYHHVLHAHTSGRAGMNTMFLTCNSSQQGQIYFSVDSSNACSVTQNGYIIPEYIYTGA